MTEVKCRALRGIKVSEDGEAVWKAPGDPLTMGRSEAVNLQKGGYLTILSNDAPSAPEAADTDPNAKTPRVTK